MFTKNKINVQIKFEICTVHAMMMTCTTPCINTKREIEQLVTECSGMPRECAWTFRIVEGPKRSK